MRTSCACYECALIEPEKSLKESAQKSVQFTLLSLKFREISILTSKTHPTTEGPVLSSSEPPYTNYYTSLEACPKG